MLLPAYIRAQSSWRDVTFLVFRKRWRVGGKEFRMEVLLVALAARMTRWDVGGRRSHTLVSFYASLCTAMTGRSTSAVCSLVATSVKTPVRTMWSYGDGLGGVGRLVSIQQRNQTRAHFPARREIGAALTHDDLTTTAWRKAKTSLQLSEMMTYVSAVSCFVFSVFFVFLSSDSTPPSP